MKRMIYILAVVMAVGCHRSMAPWPGDGDKQDVAMYVRTRSLSGITASPSVYQFFVYDQVHSSMSRYSVNPEKEDNNVLHLKLFPGTYTGYCVTNAEETENWEYTDNLPPGEIFLKSGKTETGDHLLGQSDFTVAQDGDNSAVFDLNRKVGMLRVTIENIPEWLTDLQINLSNISQKMSLTGEYKGDCSITKNIGLPDENGTSVTTLLVFPPKEKAILTLSSNSMVFVTPEHPIESILANRITEIKAIFKDPAATSELDITTRLADWDETILQEADWEVDKPQGPCTGVGNGTNLVLNGSFESDFIDDLPDHWNADVSSKEYAPRIVSVTSPTQEGSKAVRIEGKTYLYQDIPVTGGQCYQLKMYVNAPAHEVKWRSWCTWMKGSKNLPSDALHSPSYQYETSGYIDAYAGKVFRAPADATKLRVEIRNYMDPVEGKGLYVDAIRVEAVD